MNNQQARVWVLVSLLLCSLVSPAWARGRCDCCPAAAIDALGVTELLTQMATGNCCDSYMSDQTNNVPADESDEPNPADCDCERSCCAAAISAEVIRSGDDVIAGVHSLGLLVSRPKDLQPGDVNLDLLRPPQL